MKDLGQKMNSRIYKSPQLLTKIYDIKFTALEKKKKNKGLCIHYREQMIPNFQSRSVCLSLWILKIIVVIVSCQNFFQWKIYCLTPRVGWVHHIAQKLNQVSRQVSKTWIYQSQKTFKAEFVQSNYCSNDCHIKRRDKEQRRRRRQKTISYINSQMISQGKIFPGQFW